MTAREPWFADDDDGTETEKSSTTVTAASGPTAQAVENSEGCDK